MKIRTHWFFAPLADAYRRKGAFQKAIQICESGLKKTQKLCSGLCGF